MINSGRAILPPGIFLFNRVWGMTFIVSIKMEGKTFATRPKLLAPVSWGCIKSPNLRRIIKT